MIEYEVTEVGHWTYTIGADSIDEALAHAVANVKETPWADRVELVVLGPGGEKRREIVIIRAIPRS